MRRPDRVLRQPAQLAAADPDLAGRVARRSGGAAGPGSTCPAPLGPTTASRPPAGIDSDRSSMTSRAPPGYRNRRPSTSSPNASGGDDGAGGSTTSGRASMTSNSRAPAASVASSRWTAAASGPTASNVAIAASGSVASSTSGTDPRADGVDPDPQHDDRAQPGQQRRRAGRDRADGREPCRRAVHRTRRGEQPRSVRLVAIQRGEVADPADGVEREGRGQRARGDPLPRGLARGDPDEPGHDEARGDREGQQDPAGDRIDPAQQHAAEGDRARGRDRRDGDPGERLLQGPDVGRDAGEQVAAARPTGARPAPAARWRRRTTHAGRRARGRCRRGSRSARGTARPSARWPAPGRR